MSIEARLHFTVGAKEVASAYGVADVTVSVETMYQLAYSLKSMGAEHIKDVILSFAVEDLDEVEEEESEDA